MANMLFTNNASTTLSGSLTNVATTMNVATSTGALFPAPTGSQYFYCTLQSATTSTQIEIVKVTARTADAFTIVRGQDNTTAQAFANNDIVELRIVAAELNDFPKLDEVNTFTQVQTLGGAIVSSGIVEDSATINNNYTIGTGNNAVSAGPITVASGVTVTVPTGSVWSIV